LELAIIEELMERSDFEIGQDFWCGGKRWRCTDIGSRVIVAICLEPHEIVTSLPGEQSGSSHREVRSISNNPKLLDGPPYGVVETVFDEYDMEGCTDLEGADSQ
jgi:hypothetical protein